MIWWAIATKCAMESVPKIIVNIWGLRRFGLGADAEPFWDTDCVATRHNADLNFPATSRGVILCCMISDNFSLIETFRLNFWGLI